MRVAVLGAGTVGRAVVRGLLENPERVLAADGRPLVLIGVAARDLQRARAAGIPAELLTDAPAHLVASPETDVVVELMGGDEPARTLIAAALGAGKPVVTANKHVVAHHGPVLEAIARRAEVPLRFEAAVGGGIPVLGALAEGLAADRVDRVRGIVNGTTNHILSAMGEDGRSYADVLAEAQALGYAEADPSGDVEGDDAANKLVILARLAFGHWLEPGSVTRRPPTACASGPTGAPGITGVTLADLEGAAALGLTIKLLAMASRDDERAIVVPTGVPADGPFGRTGGVTNRVEIDATPVGRIGLSGPGAGGGATSSAVLGDLVAIARGLGSTWAGLAPATEPAIPAGEPFTEPRAWFTILPGVAPAAAQALPGARIAATAHGLAIVTAVQSLEAARAAIGALLPGGAGTPVNATLYPVDD
jgi:homoserine dehydrogenase